VVAEVADELRVRPECQRSHVGAQAIRAHHQVEHAWCGSLEGDLDPLIPLDEAGDGVVEEVLDVVPGG
jgi:hypothetical protein